MKLLVKIYINVPYGFKSRAGYNGARTVYQFSSITEVRLMLVVALQHHRYMSLNNEFWKYIRKFFISTGSLT